MAQRGAQHVSRDFSRVFRTVLLHEFRDFFPVFRGVEDGRYIGVGWRDGDSVVEGKRGVGELMIIPAGGYGDESLEGGVEGNSGLEGRLRLGGRVLDLENNRGEKVRGRERRNSDTERSE